MIEAKRLQSLAYHRMYMVPEYTLEWCYWRGVAVAAEAVQSQVTTESWLNDLSNIINAKAREEEVQKEVFYEANKKETSNG